MEQLKTPLERKTKDKLVDLLNLLKGYHETTEEYLNWVETEEELRGLLIHDIINDLITEKNYDGDNDCDVMYWFTKGIQSEKERQKMEEDAINDLMNMGYQEPIKHMKIPHVPKQMKQPKRYVDSDEFKRKEDEKYFKKMNKDKYKKVDPFDEHVRDKMKAKFNYRIQKESNEIKNMERVYNTSKEVYKEMLDKLVNEKPILRPLPPGEMLDLKPNSEYLFEKNNEMLIDYFTKFGHEFENKDDEYLIVNEPHDKEKARAELLVHRKKYLNVSEMVTKNKKDPIVVYYLNDIYKLEDIFDYLKMIL